MADRLMDVLPDDVEQQDGCAVHLIGGPYVAVAGHRLEVPEGSKRLLAFVALNPGVVDRRFAAGSLWPEVDDTRAAGNLRSALWRLRGAGIEVIVGDKNTLTLGPATVVDVTQLNKWAAQTVNTAAATGSLVSFDCCQAALDLLPGWYDDWVIFERERLRQKLLHAFEALALRLITQRRFAEAVETALLAVRADPLRESAQRVLLRVHLAEGNVIEARRAYLRYRDTLKQELGVLPGPEISSLLPRLGPSQNAVPPSPRRLPG
jgi:DNA-binding SARP family transcriptional activator